MILQTALAWADDLRAASASRPKARILAFLSCAALFLAVVLPWIDGRHSAAVLFISLALGGLGLIGHTVSVLLRVGQGGAKQVGAGGSRPGAAGVYARQG